MSRFSDKEKIRIYESLLHKLQCYAEVTLDQKKVVELLGHICNWSYAHRSGNGALSDEEQQERIDNALIKIRDAV